MDEFNASCKIRLWHAYISMEEQLPNNESVGSSRKYEQPMIACKLHQFKNLTLLLRYTAPPNTSTAEIYPYPFIINRRMVFIKITSPAPSAIRGMYVLPWAGPFYTFFPFLLNLQKGGPAYSTLFFLFCKTFKK